MSGRDQVAKLLKQVVIDYLRYDEDFKYDHKIAIRVYANLKRARQDLCRQGYSIEYSCIFMNSSWVNKAQPLCDFRRWEP